MENFHLSFSVPFFFVHSFSMHKCLPKWFGSLNTQIFPISIEFSIVLYIHLNAISLLSPSLNLKFIYFDNVYYSIIPIFIAPIMLRSLRLLVLLRVLGFCSIYLFIFRVVAFFSQFHRDCCLCFLVRIHLLYGGWHRSKKHCVFRCYASLFMYEI